MLDTYLDNFEGDILVGVDETARGTFIGPVAAAAVIWDPAFKPATEEDAKLYDRVKDSKKLSAKQRTILAEFIKRNAVDFAIGTVDNVEIDRINILQATFKAMHVALDQLKISFDRIAVDGNKFKTFINKEGDFVPHTCIVKGDTSLFQIAAASILAKVYRDSLVEDLHNANPDLQVYNWVKNKGYGTAEHIAAIQKHGLSPHHRRSFCLKYAPGKKENSIIK